MKFKNIIYIIIFNILFLTSCSSNKNIDTAAVSAGIDISENGSDRSDLYARAGVSDLKIKTARTDPFNLRVSHTGYFYKEDIYV
jgi:PBP1b-binding outer membrane lipoprotein LpoB